MRKIYLTQGKAAIVDDIDFEYLMQWKWYFVKGDGYARRNSQKSETLPGNKRKPILMHRVVLNRKLGHDEFIESDHENTNGLDNRRSNLRPASHSQNGANRKSYCGSSSKFKGVTWHKAAQKWQAAIRFQGKNKQIGCFDIEAEAAKAYNKMAIEYFGEFARLNDV